MKRVNCTKCGVRIIPYNYNYIFDAVNRRDWELLLKTMPR